MAEPIQGDLRIWLGGRSWSVWYYDDPPEGLRAASLRDLYPGRAILYQVKIGPNEGKWASDFVRPSTREALAARIRDGEEIFIK